MPLRDTTWSPLATLPAAAVLCLVVTVTAACGGGAHDEARPASTPTSPTAGTRVAASGGSDSAGAASVEPARPVRRTGGDVRHWERVLDRLDRWRSRAFERLRPTLLKRVYVAGSVVLRHERATLDDYRDRGVRLLGVRLRLTKVRVVSASRNHVTVRVVERLGPTRAVVGSRRVRLPVDAPTSRVLHLVRREAGWRIAAARRVSG